MKRRKLTLVPFQGWVLTCVASGMESAAHIAEDTKSPARTVPLAMFWSVAATYIMGWIVGCCPSDLTFVADPCCVFTVYLRASCRK